MSNSQAYTWVSLARDVARLVIHERDTAALLGQVSRLLAETHGRLSVALGYLGTDGALRETACAGPRADGLREALPRLLAGQPPAADLLTVPLAHGRRPVGLLVAAGVEDDPEARDGLLDVARDLGEGLGAATEVERSLTSLVEETEAPAALFDRDMRYLAASRAWAVEFGPGDQPLRGRSHYDVFPDLPERWRAAHRRCLAGAVERSDDDTFVRPDGRTEHLRWACIPWRRPDGQVGGLLISSCFTTEAREAERALRSSEARVSDERAMLRTLVDTIPDLVWLKDPDGRYLAANRRCSDVLGLPEANIVGRTDLDLFPREVAEAYRAHDRRAVASTSPTTEDEWVTFVDGHRELVQTTKTPMRAPDGRLLGVLGVARDVTAVRQAHAELARAEAELRTLSLAVEHSPVMVKITDPAGRIEYANPRVRERHGAEAAPGKPCWFLEEGPPALRAAVEAGLEWRGELERSRPGAAPFVARVAIAPVRDAAGAVTHLITHEEDVTAARAGERTLREVREQLLHAQKMEAVGALAGGVAHDFNNLITVISGFIGLVLDLEPLRPEARGRLQQALRASDRGAELTRQLLAFSRKLPTTPKVVDLTESMRGLAPMIRRLIGEHLSLQLQLEPTPGRVLVDPGQLEQVVMNLVVNARDASRTGGSIRLEVAPARLTGQETGLRMPAPPGPCVRLSVIDTGEGMDAQVQARIFEPFFSTKPQGQGTGLGLATVYGILQQAGAALGVTSAPGRGTRFDLYFPVVDAPCTPADERKARTPRGRGETILLVEDEPSVLAFIRELLTDGGYQVLAGGLPERALELARTHPGKIDLVVSDMVMPQLDGPAVVARLREQRPGLPALFLSGYPGDGRHVDEPILPKPVGTQTLLAAVRAALDGQAKVGRPGAVSGR